MSNATTRQTEGDKMKQAGGHAAQAGHEAAQGVGQKAQDLASAAGQKAQDLAHTAGQKAQDLAHTASQKAQDLAHAAGQKIQDAAHAAEQRAEDATASLGGGLKSAADTVRRHTPDEGMLGRASEAVASTLERGGSYLQEKNLSGMADDITDMIKRYPVGAVLIGLGLGFLLGRTLRS
jgi:ElaB/YqjD/DUF883 family membrane-anchored ribosome-binding protein